jgi:hypothetical protein
MIENISLFIDQIYAAPSIVWTMAIIMSAIAGYMLECYLDDMLFAVFSACAMFVAIMIGHVVFIELNVLFTYDREANVVASAGAAVCCVTVMAIITGRIWNAYAENRHRMRG